MYSIYKILNENDPRGDIDHDVFPAHIDFTIGVELRKDEGRFYKGRPVSWKYYTKDNHPVYPNELIAEVKFDDWNFHPQIGVPLQRPFKIYFYQEDGTLSTEYVDKTTSYVNPNGTLALAKIKSEGHKRRQNVINQLEGDLIMSLTVYYMLQGNDQNTASIMAVTDVSTAMSLYESSGDIPLYISSDLVSPSNPSGSQLRDKIQVEVSAWLDYTYYDYLGQPTVLTNRSFIVQELTDIV